MKNNNSYFGFLRGAIKIKKDVVNFSCESDWDSALLYGSENTLDVIPAFSGRCYMVREKCSMLFLRKQESRKKVLNTANF
ncbi:hypothetical protein ASQ44_00340 [Rickettsia rhipicephali]|nr:hypothetical protein [Rickettsia rhipicephali]ALN40767.1 hypothetical protein ASQ44_00340 [Rickettsia rhipicephali]